jgi:hypothetical protein
VRLREGRRGFHVARAIFAFGDMGKPENPTKSALLWIG